MFNTPILLITFNRPDHVRKVLTEILKQEPQSLYVCQDGAREGNENDRIKCQKVCEVIFELTSAYKASHINFELHTLYQDKNLGCGPGPATGITWFFENVEQGIIIEDDAVPHPDFFGYAEELLVRYKDNTDVRAIGSMHLDNYAYGDGSYYFSMMNRTLCAWATWRRAWQDFDLYLRSVSREQLNKCLKAYGCSLRMREYWCERLEEVQYDAYHYSSWDQQFWMSIWLHQGKGIMPNVNLCSNIGFDVEGTHTTNSSSVAANCACQPILPLTHPSDMHIQKKADLRFQQLYFEPWNYGWLGFKRLPYRLNKRLKRFVGHKGSWLKK